MADPNPTRSLRRVWIGVLAVVIIAWIIYAVTRGPSTPAASTGTPGAPAEQR
jgi:hypothetical protein